MRENSLLLRLYAESRDNAAEDKYPRQPRPQPGVPVAVHVTRSIDH
jgi:hypothetical protein